MHGKASGRDAAVLRVLEIPRTSAPVNDWLHASKANQDQQVQPQKMHNHHSFISLHPYSSID